MQHFKNIINDRKKIISIILSSIVLLILVGMSLAHFTNRFSGNSDMIATGDISMAFVGGENNIVVKGAPIYDEDVTDDASYMIFSIENTGDYTLYSEVYLENIVMTSSVFKSSDLKWSIEEGDGINNTDFANDGSYIASGDFSRVDEIDNSNVNILATSNIILEPNKTRYFKVRVWLRENGGDQSDFMNQQLSLKVGVRGHRKQTLYAANYDSIRLSGTSSKNYLNNLKIYGNNLETDQLPSGYQQIEYIESTGTQYIDTGLKGTNNTEVELDIQYVDTETSNSTRLFGARTGQSKAIFIGSLQATTSSFYVNFNSTNFSSANTLGLGRHKIELKDNTVYVDGAAIYNNLNTSTEFTTDYNLILAGANTSGTIASAKAKYFGCKIWDNGVLLRDFIPAYRESDGAIGMYDVVNNVFYTSASSEQFLSGNNVLLGIGDLVTTGDYAGKYKIDIVSSGKNLFDTSNLERGGAMDATGVNASSIYRVRTKNLIPLTAGTYTISSDDIYFRAIHVYNYDTEKWEERYWIPNKSSHTFTINDRKKVKLIFQYATGNTIEATIDDVINSNVLLERGNTITEYEPYRGFNFYTVYLNQPLRKVGDVSDYIDFKNQKLVRYIDVIDSGGTLPLQESYKVLETPIITNINFPQIKAVDSVTTIFTGSTNNPYIEGYY